MKTSKTIVQIINEWLDGLDVAEVSKRSYRSKVGLWFRWLSTRHYAVRTPTRQQVLEYKHWLENEGRSALTIDGYITAVRLFYRYCQRQSYVAGDITQGVRTATRLRGYRKLPLTREDAKALLDSIDTSTLKGKRDKLIIATMMLLGLRTCEIERIDLCDLSTDSVSGAQVVRVQRKGRLDKAEAMALTPYLEELLKDYMTEREVQEWHEPLFLSVRREHGKRFSRTSISDMVHDRLRAIGIDDPKITAHSLRHTCACLMLAEGVEMETVRDMLGHTSTSTTRLYTQQMQATLLIRNSPAKRLERALNLVKA